MHQSIALVAALVLLAPTAASAQGEAAEMARIYQACRDSGGVAASNYSDWVAQNGCQCNGVASGAQTCSGSASSPQGTGADGGLISAGAQNAVQGFMSGDANQAGAGVLELILGQALLGDPEGDARRAQEAAQAAEQQRQAQERYKAEQLRQQELSRQRILGAIKGSESSTGLAVKIGDSDSALTISEGRGAFGSTEVVPIGIGAPPASHGLALKLGDTAEQGSARAGQGFDTAGKILASDLPPPPPAPDGKLIAERAQRISILRSGLKKNEADAQALKDSLAQLQQAATPDPVAIGQVQEKIATNETEKKKLMLDLTAEDPDDSESTPSPSNPDTTSSGKIEPGGSP